MRTYKELPSQEYLNSILEYKEGNLYWKSRKIKNQVKEGKLAGWIDKTDYYRITIDNKKYQLHAIIWKMIYGKDPIYQIDHINHVRTDNRIENLRDTNENNKNMSKSKANTSGFTNIYINKTKCIKKYQVKFRAENYSKSFLTLEEAIIDRNKKYIEFNYHENHGI